MAQSQPKSAFSARPSSLKDPVPGDDEAAAVAAFLAEQKPTAAPTVEPNEEDAVNQFLANQPSGGVLPDNQFAPEPGFVEANTPGPDVISNFVTRLQAGLAANDNEKLGFLQKKFGPENALVKNGKLYYRKGAEEKFKKLDPDTFELINDLIPDFAREAVTEAAMLPGEAAGAIAGTPAAGPGPGTLMGAIAGRVASVPMANEFADQVARAAGVPRDPGRNKTTEDLTMMGAETVIPFAGKYAAKFIPGTAAYKAAKEAGEKELAALDIQSKEVAQAAADLAAEGRAFTIDGSAVGLPGANVDLMGHHLAPNSPKIKTILNSVASLEKFQNAQNQLAEGWGESARNVLREIAMRGNKGPVAPEKLGETVVNAVETVRKAEGLAIDKFKREAMKNLKNQKVPLAAPLQEQLTGITKELGFKMRAIPDVTVDSATGKTVSKTRYAVIPPKDLRPLVGKYGITSMGEARALVNTIGDVARAQVDGGIRITDLERLRNTVGGLSDSFYGTQAGAELSRMAANLRGQYRETIAKGLPDADKQPFLTVMGEYSTLMDNVEALKRSLKDNASSKAVVTNFFSGKENIDKIKAIKAIAPEAMPMLKEEWINQQLLKFATSKETRTGFDSAGFLSALNETYGPQFMKEVIDDGPGPNSKTLKDILLVMRRLEGQTKGATVDQMDEQTKQGIMNVLIGGVWGIKFKTMNGVTGLLRGLGPRENAALEIMTRDGIDKYVANYPGKIDKKSVMQNLNDILATNKVFKAIEKNATKGTTRRMGVRAGVEAVRPEQSFEAEDNRPPGE